MRNPFGQLITHRRDATSETVRRFPGTGPIQIQVEWERGTPIEDKRRIARRHGMVLVGPRGDTELYQKIMTGDFVQFRVNLENEPQIVTAGVAASGPIAPPMF